MSQILEAANGGSNKTNIMYKAYLSYAQLKEYLSILVANGLLEYEEAEQQYKTSQKGVRFMRTYLQISEIAGPLTTEVRE